MFDSSNTQQRSKPEGEHSFLATPTLETLFEIRVYLLSLCLQRLHTVLDIDRESRYRTRPSCVESLIAHAISTTIPPREHPVQSTVHDEPPTTDICRYRLVA